MAPKGRYSPLNPVVLGTPIGCPVQNGHENPITSAVVGNNADLMQRAAALWITPEDRTIDVSYGKGVFWRNLDEPDVAHDLRLDGVDCRKLPHEDESFDVLVLDPPYRPTHGSKDFSPDQHTFADVYGLGGLDLDTINDVLDLYAAAMREAHRVLADGGRIMVKCQDLSYNNRLHLVTYDILRTMTEAGFDFADQFVLANQGRPKSSRWKTQGRARRSHSVLWVGIKVPAEEKG